MLGEGSLVMRLPEHTHHTGGVCYGGLMFVWVYCFSWRHVLVTLDLEKKQAFGEIENK